MPGGDARPAAGPADWRGLTQAELDAAYDQSVWAPNMAQVMERWAMNSLIVRTRLGEPQRHAYGPTSIEALDLFTTPHAHAPIHIFIHGGGWRGGLARDYAFPAELFVHAGAHFVVPDFTNVLETGGDLMPLAAQLKRAIAWVHANARSFGGDPARIYLSGHSSGAHLAGVLLTTDWRGEFGLPDDIIKGGLLASGMYDLEPVARSARRNYVAFTAEIEQALSAQRHLDRLHARLTVAYGTHESPEFQRQAREFAATVQAAGKPVSLLTAFAYNHFEILETLASPYGLLGRAALAQLGLQPS